MLTEEQIKQSAAYHIRARQDHKLILDMPDELVPRSEEEGYAVQDAVLAWHKENEADEIGGYKAGVVSYKNRVFMGGSEVIGYDNPLFAGLRNSTIYRDEAVMKIADYCLPKDPPSPIEPEPVAMGPRVESEFAVRIGEDVPVDGAPYTRDSIGEFVAECLAGIELVDPRMEYADYGVPFGGLMIADYGGNWGAVFGHGRTDWKHLDLAALRTRIIIDGKEADTGTGADLAVHPPGHPFEILAWLTNHLIRFGGRRALPASLREGDLLLLGSAVVSQYGFKAPAEMICEWDELGAARVRWE